METLHLNTPAFVIRKTFTPSDIVTIEPSYETLLCAGCVDNPGFGSGDSVFWIRFKTGATESRSNEEGPRPSLKPRLLAHPFAFNHYRLDADLTPLRPILEAARQTVMPIRIIGHTDSRGSDAYNRQLSLKRAQSVADWLVAQGIDAERIAVSGEGEHAPIASNATAAGRAANRRAEVSLTVRVLP